MHTEVVRTVRIVDGQTIETVERRREYTCPHECCDPPRRSVPPVHRHPEIITPWGTYG